ncbi:MAG TPA: hypothetical protein VMP86_04515 [Candidatus Binatia bacterium]|nr:hypothetical protein [Candidatus Binatia bacterium]
MAVLLSACALLAPPAVDPQAGSRVTCGGGPAFSIGLLAATGSAETAADPAAQALRRHLATDDIEINGLPDAGWIEAARSGSQVLYLAPEPTSEGSWHFVTVDLEGAAWDVGGWGGCALQPDVGPLFGIASFRIAPGAELGPDVTEIHVLVTERACNSGEDASGRIVNPAVVLGEERVVVTFAVRPRGGDQTCPSNPETPFVLELPEPLGDRALFDGSTVPPRDATVCPDIASCP